MVRRRDKYSEAGSASKGSPISLQRRRAIRDLDPIREATSRRSERRELEIADVLKRKTLLKYYALSLS